MKKNMNKHVILLSAAVVLLFSCTRESDQEVIQPGETITFTAAWAGSEDTRTILQADGTSVWWEPEAQINVFFSDKASGKFTSTNSQAQSIVDFQGSLPIVVGSVETENPAHAYWAVYPYDSANSCDGKSVTLTIPATQTAAAGTFDNKMFPSIATSTNFYLAFYNVCGGVRFTVYNEGIQSVSFKANNGEFLAGKVQVGFDGVPVVKNVIDGKDEVTVKAPDGGFVPGTYYFATLLPQTLTKGMSLTFRNSDGKVATTSLDNSITVNRSRFGKLDEKDKDLTFVDDGSSHDPTDAIVFADPKVKEKLVAAFDTNSDGELSYAEAAAVTSGADVKAAFGAIKTYKSFDEFQYFTGVTTIPASMFENWNLLTSISLPSRMNSIFGSAFQGCQKLEKIIIPAGVTLIHNYAFSGCSSLSHIDIPESIVNIGFHTFSDCTSLASVSIPENVSTISGYAFSGCSSLMSISIPEKVTSIGEYAFSGCSSLTTISIPEKVQSIESHTFSGCTSLTGISLPENVRTISDYAFADCSSLVRIIIPESVTSIGNRVFSGCRSLTGIIIPDSVTRISEYAFYDCTSLTNISITENVSVIQVGAFYGCSSLTSIFIPESVTSIGDVAFRGCSRLVDINLPESVTSIGAAAFRDCASLINVTLPESVSSIDDYTFSGCRSLIFFNIPSSITQIGGLVFDGCRQLSSIIVQSDTPPTGSFKMFDGNNAVIIVPPERVEEFRTAEYWRSYADRIQALQETQSVIHYTSSDGKSVALRFSNSFDVPIINNVYENGKGTITLDGEISRINDFAFSGCDNLASIIIPSSVKSIGEGVFELCSALSSITVESDNSQYDSRNNCNAIIETGSNTLIAGCKNTVIPNGIITIGPFAFYNNLNLSSIAIPSTVTSIGDGAFAYCSSLASITIPVSVTNLGTIVFEGCSGLSSITVDSNNPRYDSRNNCNAIIETSSNTLICGSQNTFIPEGVTVIGVGAFAGMSSIVSIAIPSTVISIEESAFNSCTNLSSIVIPESVMSIAPVAFFNCNSLTSITVLSAIPPSGGEAMFGDTNNAPLYVPSGSVDAYKSAEYWSDYASRIQAIQE